MFERWGIQAPPSWNQSGDPCTGDAVNDNVEFKDKNYKILIKCDSCNLASCHINQLYVSPTQGTDKCFSSFLHAWIEFMSFLFLQKSFWAECHWSCTRGAPKSHPSLQLVSLLLSHYNLLDFARVANFPLIWQYLWCPYSYLFFHGRQLDRNYLTGTLPAFIGKLTNLQYM